MDCLISIFYEFFTQIQRQQILKKLSRHLHFHISCCVVRMRCCKAPGKVCQDSETPRNGSLLLRTVQKAGIIDRKGHEANFMRKEIQFDPWMDSKKRIELEYFFSKEAYVRIKHFATYIRPLVKLVDFRYLLRNALSFACVIGYITIIEEVTKLGRFGPSGN